MFGSAPTPLKLALALSPLAKQFFFFLFPIETEAFYLKKYSVKRLHINLVSAEEEP
jgi:hypothetical protein